MAKEDQTKKPKEKRGIDQSQKVINARVSVDEFKARQDELYLGKDPDPNRKISENSILTGCTNHNSDETILSQFTIKGKNGAGVYTIPPAVQRPIPGTPKDIKQNAMNRDTNRGASANKSYQNPIDEIPVANYNADSGRGKTNRSKKRGLSHKSDRKGDKKTEPPTKNSAMENEQPERPSNKEKYPPWYYTADDDKKQDGSDEQVPPVGVLPAAPGSRSSSTPADRKSFTGAQPAADGYVHPENDPLEKEKYPPWYFSEKDEPNADADRATGTYKDRSSAKDAERSSAKNAERNTASKEPETTRQSAGPIRSVSQQDRAGESRALSSVKNSASVDPEVIRQLGAAPSRGISQDDRTGTSRALSSAKEPERATSSIEPRTTRESAGVPEPQRTNASFEPRETRQSAGVPEPQRTNASFEPRTTRESAGVPEPETTNASIEPEAVRQSTTGPGILKNAVAGVVATAAPAAVQQIAQSHAGSKQRESARATSEREKKSSHEAKVSAEADEMKKSFLAAATLSDPIETEVVGQVRSSAVLEDEDEAVNKREPVPEFPTGAYGPTGATGINPIIESQAEGKTNEQVIVKKVENEMWLPDSVNFSRATVEDLITIVAAITTDGRGILVADESPYSMERRMKEVEIPNTPENRGRYRELLFSCPKAMNRYIGGVVVHHETFSQRTLKGKRLIKLLKDRGIKVGVKIDKGVVALPGCRGESAAQGLDHLNERCQAYKKDGAEFLKWRSVFKVGKHSPTQTSLMDNCMALAQFAQTAQRHGLVPILEAEVLPDGEHDLEKAQRVSEKMLSYLFKILNDYNILLEGMLLMTNFITCGISCTVDYTAQDIAEATIKSLRRSVPPAVAAILMMSGGMSDTEATTFLQNVNTVYENVCWQITFAYGRALQATTLYLWNGNDENRKAAQEQLMIRARFCRNAAQGTYAGELD